MSISINPLAWLNWLMPPVTKLEKQIFDEVIAVSEEKYQALLKGQVSSFNYAQRSPGGRDVMFYKHEKGRSVEKGKALDVKNPEILWAKAKVTDKQTKKKINVEAWLINGRISNLVYNGNPSKFHNADCSIEITYLVDVEKADRPGFDEKLLPPDLKEAANKYSGEGNGIVFMFPEETYHTVDEQGSFIVIGEVVDVGVFMVKANDKGYQGKIYIGFYDGSKPKVVGATCKEAARMYGDNVRTADSRSNPP